MLCILNSVTNNIPYYMDPLTILIAKYIGPVVFLVGLGIFFSRAYYARVYRNLEQETLAVLMGGISILVAGIAVVMYHNIWTSFAAGVISFIGWASIVKGVMLIVLPKSVDIFGDMIAESKLFPVMAILATTCGAYVTYVGYVI